MSINDPIAQDVEAASNPTVKAKSAQNTRWLAIVATGAILSGGVLYWVVFAKPAPGHTAGPAAVSKVDEKRNSATVATLSPQQISPEAKNVDLNTQIQQMQNELDAEKQKSAALINEKEGLTQQLAMTQGAANEARSSRERGPVGSSIQSSYRGTASGGAPANSPNVLRASPNQSAQIGPGGYPSFAGSTPGMSVPGATPDAPPSRQIKVINFGSGSGSGDSSGAGGAQAQPIPTKGAKKEAIDDITVYDTAEYVPANSYVTAVVINGVDMQTSATGASDPKPVLFRINGDAQGVGMDGHYQVSHLKGCMVNGAAQAELSSEKVYIKLEKITCPVGPGKYMESKVEGYVSFKGKDGVRGRVVSREGDFAAKAFVAGTLQGLGQAESMNVQRITSGIGTNAQGQQTVSTAPLTGSQMTQAAIGSGVGNGSSMLAQYYINKAEQYQPVIEMPTGVQVELVFISGFRYSYKVNSNGKQ